MVGIKRASGAILYESGECPDHGKHLVFIGQDGLGAVGGYSGLKQYTELGGSLTVFTLP